MRVMQPVGHQGYQQSPYSQQERQVISSPYSQGSQPNYNGNYGGEMGYKNVNKQSSQHGSYGGYSGQIDQIDIAMQQHEMKRPPSVPRQSPIQQPTQGKSSIKINGPPKQNFSIGNDYNYW